MSPGDVTSKKTGEDSKQACFNMFMNGECKDRTCLKRHTINLKKVQRGICVHEFDAADSCPWGKKCMYTHDFPPEILVDQNIIDKQKKLRRNVKQRQNHVSFEDKKGVRPDNSKLEKVGPRKQTKDQYRKNNDNYDESRSPRKNRYPRHDRNENVLIKDDVAVNSQMTNQSFLELIRPMIMGQFTGMMKGFFKEQENQMQKTVKKFMLSQQLKTV